MSTFKIDKLFDVKDKVVVVTGGGTGLGKAIATGFATNGATVFITGRREEVLENAAKTITAEGGGRCTPIKGDTSSKAGCTAMAEAIGKHTDHVDVLVCNAGMIKAFREQFKKHPNDHDEIERVLRSVEDDDFSQTNATNVAGVWFTATEMLPLLRKSSDASVIVIASIAAFTLPRAGGSATYGASKAAALHLGQNLASRLSPLNIRVNTLCPGIFPSQMTGKPGDPGAQPDLTPGMDIASRRSAMGRAGRLDEIVGPALMLSSRAGGYMTGSFFVVDGGRVMANSVDDGIQLQPDLYSWSAAPKS